MSHHSAQRTMSVPFGYWPPGLADGLALTDRATPHYLTAIRPSGLSRNGSPGLRPTRTKIRRLRILNQDNAAASGELRDPRWFL